MSGLDGYRQPHDPLFGFYCISGTRITENTTLPSIGAHASRLAMPRHWGDEHDAVY